MGAVSYMRSWEAELVLLQLTFLFRLPEALHMLLHVLHEDRVEHFERPIRIRVCRFYALRHVMRSRRIQHYTDVQEFDCGQQEVE